ncbi:MAG: sigma-54-dependent transcriptional regulator [Thermodesulfobacteriota bacterium]
MSVCKVLVVEDEEYIRESLCEMLEMQGYRAVAVPDGEAGVEQAKKEDYDIVLTDLRLPGIGGIDVIRAVKEISPETICLVLTGYASVESAVEAMRAGAHTYLQKPLNKDQLLVTLEKAREVRDLAEENARLKDEIKGKFTGTILGSSPRIQSIRRLIEKVADTDSTVLILGESGTGKELVARALHYCSSRSRKNFVPINCGAIPEDLLESELFGHEKGAFTGAIATKIGRFEAADKGTVFLDEIGEMSPSLQVKILRVLQEKEFERVGGRETIKVDVRVVAATNQDLEKAVEEKRFREDLFYRLNVIPLCLPPLRERREDVPLLAAEFMKRICGCKNKTLHGIAPEAMALLESYDWPGNVRELENLIERLVVLKDEGETVTPADLTEKIRGKAEGAGALRTITLPSDGVDFNMAVYKFERDLILNALDHVDGVKKKAAEYLNLNRTTLIEKMKRMGITEPVSVLGSGGK